MDEFVAKGKVCAKLHHGLCEYLVDDYEYGIKHSESISLNTILSDMVTEQSMVKFLHKMDFCHCG